MNERIKQLEKQAWDYAYDHETVKGKVANDGFINMNFSDAFSQKFAELIVRECMEVASPNYMSTPEDSVYYVEQAINRIAKHFGVEND